MDVIAVTALCLAGVSALLLTVILIQLRALGTKVLHLTSARPEARATAREEDPLRRSLSGELKAIESQIGKFDIVFSEIQRQLNTVVQQARTASSIGGRAADAPAQPTLATPIAIEPWNVGPADRGIAAQAPSPDRGTATPVIAEAQGPETAPPLTSSPSIAHLEQLVANYRELITQPRKNEINRWSDDAGGWACEIGEDGTLQPLAREAGGLMVLVPHDDNVGALLPGGRLVVDFPTSFANVMSMRRVTRHSYELINDGSGVLRLVEPAWAKRIGDTWQMMTPGKLAGLKSD